MKVKLFLVFLLVLVFVEFSIGTDFSADLDSYSAITADPTSSTKLLNLVAQEAVPAHGGNRFTDIGDALATKHVIDKINSYTPQNLEVAERYAANMVAISKLREEIYMDSKEYHESIKLQLEAIPESKKLKEILKSSEAKMKRSEEKYLESKKAAERSLEIYMRFIRPTTENVLVKAEATEGKGLKIAHAELSNMESISLPDMDTSGYEPLDADASLLSIAESVLPPEETKESLINKALEKISATIEEDFLNNNNSDEKVDNSNKKLVVEHLAVSDDDEDIGEEEDDDPNFDIRDKKVVNKETKDVSINKPDASSQIGKSEEIFGSTLTDSNDLINSDYDSEDLGASVEGNNKNDKVLASIPSSISASFPSTVDPTNNNKRIIVIPGGTTLSGKVPEHFQYIFRRSYILSYIASIFVESYVLPQFFTENPEIKLYSFFRIKRTFISHILFGLASKYRIIFKELQKLPFVYKDSELKEKIEKVVFDLSTTNLLLQNALSDSQENYRNVANLLVEFPFNVRETFSKFSAAIRVNYPNTDYSFIMNQSVYSAPRALFPELSSSGLESLKFFDKELSSKLEIFDIKQSLSDLKESQSWIKDYVLRNAAYRHYQFEKNHNIRPYFDFAQFNINLVPQVEEILKKSSFKKN
ncbi:uncharacterized protein cubi_01955 [Cryptosporidium ubiquitum]|uniref:Secreted protein n=1 Tax=Cryptosporidium ubiquitum TaxID=857276 RepID=A0A1J4MMD8_9CRYT|nr:uncharacterized protein cubi_01955 [Cryptosporidium ubiquitum]OII75434.1 hypothetical protein cubi_01955 [Cryptosporidium ubiquitum]